MIIIMSGRPTVYRKIFNKDISGQAASVYMGQSDGQKHGASSTGRVCLLFFMGAELAIQT